MKNGWIKLHRKLLDNPITGRPEWAWLWVVILLNASREDRTVVVGNTTLKLKSGQFLTGREALAQQANISSGTTERALAYMEIEQLIEQQKTNKYRIITIRNWDKYQKLDSSVDSRWTTDGQQSGHKQEEREYKNSGNTEYSEYIDNIYTIENVPSQSGGEAAVDINRVIGAFKEVNPSYANFYKNLTQRASCGRLIKVHSLENVLKVIDSLPKLNKIPYFPVITTPKQLEDKWASLKSMWEKKKAELEAKDWRKNVV